MSTSIELHNVVPFRSMTTVVAKNKTTTWRELHSHKVNGDQVTLTLYQQSKGQFITRYFWGGIILMKGKTNGTFSTRHRDSA
jgi:hypothetical protein